jgi:peptide/nickel transport system substrate-binding protein
MLQKRRVKAFQVLMFGLVFLAAAASVFAGGGSQTSSNAKDTLVIGLVVDLSTFDASKTSDINQMHYIRQIFDGLVNSDKDDQPTPGLAQSWEWSSDYTQLTFHLRSGAKFSNGDPVTADDVVFSMNRTIASSANPQYTDMMKTWRKVNDTTVVLELKNPYPVLSCLMDTCFAVYNKKLLEKDETAYFRNPIGAGPYIFKRHVSGDATYYEANPNYWAGPAKIKNLVIKVTSDKSAALIALENNEIQILTDPLTSDLDRIKQTAGIDYAYTVNANYYCIIFNHKDPKFQDIRLRQAIAMTINRNDIFQAAFNGFGRIQTVPLHPSYKDYYPADLESYALPRDTTKAKQLLAEAGYPNGFDMEFTVDSAEHYAIFGQVIQNQLREIGINCRLKVMERQAWLAAINSCQYEGFVAFSAVARIMDPDANTYPFFHTPEPGKMNMFNYSNPAMDALLDKGRLLSGGGATPERKQVYHDIVQKLMDDVVVIPMCIVNATVAYREEIKDVRMLYLKSWRGYDYEYK